MNTRYSVLKLLVRLVLIAGMVVPQMVASPPVSAAAPSAPGLVRGRHEDLDAYLRRVAAANPELFQQASLAAVQDAFNGALPQVEGEKSIEHQIAYYLHLAASGGDLQRAPTRAGASSAIQDDAYLWNGVQADEQSSAGSAWQLTARPGGDPQAFANNFEEMLSVDALPKGIPDAALGPVQPVGNPASGEPTAADAPSAGVNADDVTEPNLIPFDLTAVEAPAPETTLAAPAPEEAPHSIVSDVLNQELSRRIARTSSQNEPPLAVVATQQTKQADLGVSVTAPVTATFDDVITYTVTITNHGPDPAVDVRLTQSMPANGLYQPGVTGCAASDIDTVKCAVGALSVTQSISLTIPVQMKANGVVTSTVTVKDEGRTLDPGRNPAEAKAVTKVSSPDRSEREVGNVVIAANEFITVTGQIEASGAVEIGFREDKDEDAVFHLRLGPNDSVSWQNGSQEVSGSGTLAQIVGNFKLFEGEFTIDGSQEKPVVVPGDKITPKVKKLAGFELVGTPAITEVAVISGTATLSTTIRLGQAGVITDTKQPLVGFIKPGGKGEGTIDEFEAVVVGMNIKVKDAVFMNDKITIKRALLTMPERFGRLTGIIALMEFTATSISFGGVGVEIPIPNIYPLGAPITGTAAVTPTLSFITNTATVMVDKGLYSLQIKSTLQVWLPGNYQNIPAEFKIDAAGKMEGTVKSIKLTLAGQQLELKDVNISDKGLKVDEATLTLKRSPAKPKEGETQPTPQPLLTVVVKDVSINKDGLSFGSAEAEFPDIKFGATATLTKLTFTVETVDPKDGGGYEFGLKGKLKVHISNNDQEIAFSGKVDKDGKFSGKVENFSLTIASSKLALRDMAYENDRFTSASATLTLPPSLGRTEVTLGEVVIDDDGLSFGDATVKIPVEFTIGKQAGEPDPTNSLHVKGTLSLVIGKDRIYGFVVEGKVTIKVAAQSASVSGSFRWDTTGQMRGSVDSFELTIAGMTLAVKSATIEGSTLKAQEATLSIPKEWGGLSATVYELEISKEQFSIGGGSFTLPEIKVGDMRLSLEGTLKKEPGGWIIAAGGSLKLPNTGGGCSGVGVSVEIFAGSQGSVVMSLAPLDEPAATSFQLRKATVSLKCNIALGTSGFELTAIAGTVTLNDNVTRLEVKATIESQLRVGPFKAVTADGDMHMEYVKNPYKFEIGIGASMRIFSMFEAARAKASMTFSDGKVPFMFKAEMNINAVIAKGEVKLTAWTSNGDFHLVGRIYGSVGVRRGAISDRCWTIKVPRWGWPPYRDAEVCATIPPSDLFIDATMEFGEFKHGTGSTWGLKASVNFLGANYGIYVDSAGKFRVGNVDDYRTIDPPSLQRARQLTMLAASNQLHGSTLSAADQELLQAYRFAEEGVTIEIADVTKPGDLTINMFLADTDADLQITLIRPDGLRIAGSNVPGNVVFRQGIMSADDLRDPATGAPLTDVRPMRQTNITVTNAELGKWQIMLNREPTEEFIIHASGTIYGAPVEKMTVSGQNDTDNTVELAWHQTTELTTTAVIYATQDPITSTARYTDTQVVTQANGIAATEVITVDAGIVTQFGGRPVAEYNLAEGSQTVTRQVDLSGLKTGSYSLWLEVYDGKNPPTRRYFPGKVAVWHSWPDNWTANVRVTPALGALNVAWDAHPNPDVDGYDIEIMTPRGPYVVDAGDTRSETITGLSAQQTYKVTVNAYNARTELISVSEAGTGRPLRAPFSMRPNKAALTIPGGASASATLVLTSTVKPYPNQVFLRAVDVPDGMEVALSSTAITPTVGGARVGVVITPTAELRSGTYPVKLQAASNGDVQNVTISVTVQEPIFTPRVSSNHLILPYGGSTAVAIDATYRFGEQDRINVDVVSIPPGIDWAFTPQSFLPGEKATLVLTDTGYLLHGFYDVTIRVTDYQNTYDVTLPLTVAGISLLSDWDSQAVRPGRTASFPIRLQGNAWRQPVTLAVDPQSAGDQFITTISSATPRVPDRLRVSVTPLPETPPGIYELMLVATSGDISETLPLYVTVQDDRTATDVVMDYHLPGGGLLVAGEVFSYTLSPRNISTNPAEEVRVVDRMADRGLMTLVSSDGCRVGDGRNTTTISCDLGTIPARTRNQDRTVSWLVAPEAPDGAIFIQKGEAIVRNTSNHRETSTLDNRVSVEHTVIRVSDLKVEAASTQPTAGGNMTMTATVLNQGPSYAGDTRVTFFLPRGVSLQNAPAGCVQHGQVVLCSVGVLPVAKERKVVVTVRLEPGYRGSVKTEVSASSASYEPNLIDNVDAVLADVATSARLSLRLTPDRARAVEGDTVNFQFTVTNHGPSTATAVRLKLFRPATAVVTNVRVGSVNTAAQDLKIAAGATLTGTAELVFLEDDQGTPKFLRLEAEAHETAPVTVTSRLIAVANAVPTIRLTGNLTLDEGEVGLITVLTNDPGSNYDPFDIAWDLDGDGAFDDSIEPTVRFNTAGIDGPFRQRIAVRVTDDDGGTVTRTTAVSVRNVAPTVTTGNDQYKRYDQTFEVPFQAYDPFADDIRAARIDWGDGKVERVTLQTGGRDEQATHRYGRIGTFTASICVNDDDRGQGCAEVVLQAACRDNGLLARATHVRDGVVVTLENASGTTAIPAGMPFTLYNGDRAIRTFTLDQALEVGASRELRYPLAPGDAGPTLRLAVDDDGTGAKTTDLCSGTVLSLSEMPFQLFLPLTRQ